MDGAQLAQVLSGSYFEKSYNKAVQKYNHYFVEENRRATYKTWIFKDSCRCNADKMAEAGFIFTGKSREPDVVTCFYCDKTLDGWESSDDPWKEHLQHASYCHFAKLQKPQRQVKIKDLKELTKTYMKNNATKMAEQLKKDICESIDKEIDKCRE